MAYSDGKPIGFKVGHEEKTGHFYSWIGGVVPVLRDQSIRYHEGKELQTPLNNARYDIDCVVDLKGS